MRNRYKLRNTLILNALTAYMIVTASLMLVVTLLIGIQNVALSKQIFEKTFTLIKDDLRSRREKSIADTAQITNLPFLATAVDFVSAYKSMTDTATYFTQDSYRRLAESAYNLIQASLLREVAIYDREGDLVAFSCIHDEDAHYGYALGYPNPFLIATTVDKKIQNRDPLWQKMDKIEKIAFRFPKKIAEKTSAGFEEIDGTPCITVCKPIFLAHFDPESETLTEKPVGTIFSVQPLDKKFEERMSILTGTNVRVVSQKEIDQMDQKVLTAFRNIDATDPNTGKPVTQEQIVFNEISIDHEAYYQGIFPVSKEKENTLAISALYSKAFSRKNTWQMARYLLLVSLCSLAFTIPIAIFIAKRITAPIEALAKTAKAIAAGDLDKRAEVFRKDEIGDLGDAFNHMTEKLQQDITHRKETEEELRRLRNFLTNIIDSMPSVLIGVDKNGVVTQWNKEAEKLTGKGFKETLGRDLAEVYPQLLDQEKTVKQVIMKRTPSKDRKVETRDSGEVRFSDVTIFPLVANGIEGAVIRVDDITERMRIDEMMIQNEKMISVGGLAAGMAHEINNPLAGILQNIQVLKNRIWGDIPANIEAANACGISLETIRLYMEKRNLNQMVDMISDSGKRAADIVSDMLSFSRKSDEPYSKFSGENIGSLLDKTVEMAEKDYDLKKKYDFKKIKIHRDYDPLLPEVPCEKVKIQQVFLNILKNAAQAMFENEPSGKTPQLRLRTFRENQMARIEIEDNGPGMNENTRKRVFEPFFTTKAEGAGTGLGLSVSYFIIKENHRGSIQVESKEGEGARFIILLPLDREIREDNCKINVIK